MGTAFTFTIHDGPFLLAVATGSAEVADMCDMLDVLSQTLAAKPQKRLLIDLLSLESDLSAAEHQVLGAYAARTLGHLERVGVAVNAIYRTGVGEEAALAAGLKIRTFTNLSEAMGWMSEH